MRFLSSLRISAAALALAAPGAALAAPLFQDATANLGSPQPCADTNEGCYTHYVLMADINKDGHLDLLFAAGGGYYTPDTTAPFLLYMNDGTGHFQLLDDPVVKAFQGRVRQIAVGDVDGDGDLDIYLPQGYGDQGDGTKDAFLINDGDVAKPHFTNEAVTRLGIISRAGAARFGDVDNDGDLDLVITDWGDAPPDSPGTAHLYLNDGKGNFTEKAGAVPMDTSNLGTGPIDIDFFDADGDFDLDLMVASRKGDSLLFLNDGAGTFTNAPLPTQPGPYVYGPDECDIDNDGDLDIWLDNGAAGPHTQLLVNDGKATFTDDTAARVSNNPAADDNRVTCVDVNGDGFLDVVIASLSDNERVLLNDKTGHFTLVPDAFPVVADSTLGLDVGDVNGDGLLDVVTAQGETGSFLNRLYLGVGPDQKPDTRPPRIRAVEPIDPAAPTGNIGLRFAVVDSVTTDIGPRVKQAYLEVDTIQVPARFMGGDIFRALITTSPGKTIKYRACATDWAGNKACSEFFMATPAGGITASSSSASSAASTGSGGEGGGGGSAGAGGSDGGDSGGCGCATPGNAGAPASGVALAALALGALRRRRRA